MMKSLYSGVSGMKTHNQRMDMIGNNTANVNTTGYKASAFTFKDIFYQTKSFASMGDAASGGTNPKQIGYGSATGSIDQIMTQTGFTYSDKVYDCAIEGEGFFQVADAANNIFYTRAGVFNVDNYGNLVDPNGNIVLGVSGDPTGVDPSSQKINLFVPDVDNNQASATKQIGEYEITITAAGYGKDGNISLNVTHGTPPFATLNGSTLTVSIDLYREYTSEQEVQDAINEAIRAGGVNLPDTVIPLTIEFSGAPLTGEVDENDIDLGIKSQVASNIMIIQNPGSTIADPLDPLRLKFTTVTPGEAGNKNQVNIAGSTSATGVVAKWSGDVLTITLPTAVDDEGALKYPYTMEDIQFAMNKAAGMVLEEGSDDTFVEGSGNKNRLMTIMAVDENGEEGGESIEDFPIGDALGKNVAKIGLKDGKDNFYAGVAKKLNSVKLDGGREAGPQTVGDLDTVFINDAGEIYGVHNVHGTFLMGRIDIVTFENPVGLQQVGTSYWKASLSSGDPTIKLAGQDGAGAVVSGALEMSNVDLSQEFSDMIITQRGFQANSRIITVSDTMLEELVNLKR